MNILTRGLLGSLIMNLIFHFRKTICRAIDTNFDYSKKKHDSRVFGVADHESDIGFSKTECRFKNGVFKMAGDFRGFKFFYPKNHDLSVFGIADYESGIGFSNKAIADRQWR